jgi:hypothetical protein
MRPDPSISDWNLTQMVMTAANTCGLVLEEHLIVTPTGDFFSFKDAGYIAPFKIGGAPLKTKAASTRRPR